MAKKKFDKYLFYENSVQTPTEHVYIFNKMFAEIRNNKKALSLREDFCGTFLISCEWVKSDPKRSALGLDLDTEPTLYGKKHGFKKLTAAEKKRVRILNQDVCTPTKGIFDVIGACNFSFNIFHSHALMKKYFQAARKSLNKDGIFVLELAGGPGFIRTQKEQKTYTVRGLGKYTYYWDQKSFDPINQHGRYAIHFKDRHGVLHRDCFEYDWRVWSIPELRSLMRESGFSDVAVYWESSNKHGQGTGEFVRTKEGDNAYSWIAFVVGIK